MEDLRYPLGRFAPKGSALTAEERVDLIGGIAALPRELRAAAAGLTDERLDVPYREGGWSTRQIAHHIADSHINAFVRFKLGLTEDTPTIKPYDQEKWAALGDVQLSRLEASLSLLDGLHERWVGLLRAMTPQDFGRRVAHPELGEIDLDFLVSLYGWHGSHHVAQIMALRQRQGW
ncbi:MAG TPA: putative metal-dependent hydrolase [Longimicrobiales bacterium]|nr:putative metal-dependent hydrolase [Longimicrobiales bacterium]